MKWSRMLLQSVAALMLLLAAMPFMLSKSLNMEDRLPTNERMSAEQAASVYEASLVAAASDEAASYLAHPVGNKEDVMHSTTVVDDDLIIWWRSFWSEAQEKECTKDASRQRSCRDELPAGSDARPTRASEAWKRVIQHRRRTGHLLPEIVRLTSVHGNYSRRGPSQQDPNVEEDYMWMLPPHAKLFCPSNIQKSALFQWHTTYSPAAIRGSVVLSLRECPEPIALDVLNSSDSTVLRKYFVWKIFSAADDTLGTDSRIPPGNHDPSFLTFCIYECLRSPYCSRLVLSKEEQREMTCRLLQHRRSGRAIPRDVRADPPPAHHQLLILSLPLRPEASPSLVQSHLRWSVVRGPIDIARMDPETYRCASCVWEYRLDGRHHVEYDVDGIALVDVTDLDSADGNTTAVVFCLPQLVAHGKFTLFMNSQHMRDFVGHRLNISMRSKFTSHSIRTRSVELQHHFSVQLFWEAQAAVLVTHNTPFLAPSGLFHTQVTLSHDRTIGSAALLRENECIVTNLAIRFLAPAEHVDRNELYLAASHRNGDFVSFYISNQSHRRDTNVTCFSLVDGHSLLLRPGPVTPFSSVVVRNDCVGATIASFADDDDRPTVILTGPALYEANMTLAIPLEQLLSCGRIGSPRTDGEISGDKSYVDALPVLISSSQYRCAECVLDQLGNFNAFAPNSIVIMRIDEEINDEEVEQILQRGLSNFHPVVFYHRQSYGGTLHGHPTHSHALNIEWMEKHHQEISYSHVICVASNELLVRAGVEHFVKQYDLSGLNADVTSGFMTDKVNLFEFHSCLYCEDDESLRTGHSLSSWGLDEFGVRSEFHIAAIMRKYKLKKWPIRQVYLEGSFYRREIALVLSRIILEEFDGLGMTNSTHNLLTGNLLPEDQRHYNRGPFAFVQWYASCEVLNMLIFHSLCDDDLPGNKESHFDYTPALLGLGDRPGGRAKCGEHVGTMLWRNPDWEVQKDDVQLLRCSPFAGPFSFKRFPMDASNPARKDVLNLQKNFTRSRLLRDSYEDCKHLSQLRI